MATTAKKVAQLKEDHNCHANTWLLKEHRVLAEVQHIDELLTRKCFVLLLCLSESGWRGGLGPVRHGLSASCCLGIRASI